jgi:hypothetical protein
MARKSGRRNLDEELVVRMTKKSPANVSWTSTTGKAGIEELPRQDGHQLPNHNWNDFGEFARFVCGGGETGKGEQGDVFVYRGK